MSIANDSNHFYMSVFIFSQKKISTPSSSLQDTSTQQPPGHSPLGATSHATCPEATFTEATSGNNQSPMSASSSASELSQEIPVSTYQTYEDTIHPSFGIHKI